MPDVKVIKLLSSQELIAKIISETDNEVIIASPLLIQPMRSGEASLSIGLMPFSWAGDTRDASISLNKAHVLCTLEPEGDLKTQYLAGLSGITLPQSTTPKLTLVE